MQHTKTLLRIFAIVAVIGIATLAAPLSAQAGVRVSIGVGLPVVVAPAPVVVGGYYGPYYRPWRHHPYRWHRW